MFSEDNRPMKRPITYFNNPENSHLYCCFKIIFTKLPEDLKCSLVQPPSDYGTFWFEALPDSGVLGPYLGSCDFLH